VKRRTLIVGAAAAIAMPSLGRAQTRRRPLIGYIHPRTIAPTHSTLSSLRRAWEPLGHAEGETVLLRSAEDNSARIPSIVRELEEQGVKVLIAVGAETVMATSRATTRTPIVAIDLETDPVRSGLAASFNRPGGNVTGLFLDQPSLAAKWIDLLREAVPGLTRLALVWDPSTGTNQLDTATAVARGKGLDTTIVRWRELETFAVSLARLADGRTGLVLLTAPGFLLVSRQFAADALRARLPSIAFGAVYARQGLMMSYGPEAESFYGRAVHIAERILAGTPPAVLPIESPHRFELTINLATAKALGITMPTALMAQADEVFE
jgi:putative ABC transport system substrate-binding protein